MDFIMASFKRKIDQAAQFTVVKISGDIEPGEILAWAEQSGHDQRTRLVLWDLTNSTWSGIPTNLLMQNFSTAQKYVKPGYRTAFVVNSEVDYGLGRIIENMMEAAEFTADYRPFLSLEKARNWLLQKNPATCND